MKDTNQQTNAKGGKKGKRFSAWYILGGGVLKEDFVVKHKDRVRAKAKGCA